MRFLRERIGSISDTFAFCSDPFPPVGLSCPVLIYEGRYLVLLQLSRGLQSQPDQKLIPHLRLAPNHGNSPVSASNSAGLTDMDHHTWLPRVSAYNQTATSQRAVLSYGAQSKCLALLFDVF